MLLIGCPGIAALRQIKKKNMADGEDEQEAVEVDQKLSESQKFSLYKEFKGYRSLWDTSYVPSKNKQQKDRSRGSQKIT